MQKNQHQGFTMIELIIVIGLIGVIASFSAAMSLSSLSKSNATQERDLFVSLLLRGARAKALANIDQKPHGVYIDDSCHRYILFEGISFTMPAGTCPTSGLDSIDFTNKLHNPPTVANSGGKTIVFEQLSGNVTTGSGTTTFSSNGVTLKVNIRSNGQIDW